MKRTKKTNKKLQNLQTTPKIKIKMTDYTTQKNRKNNKNIETYQQ